jgi:hypothetical protein
MKREKVEYLKENTVKELKNISKPAEKRKLKNVECRGTFSLTCSVYSIIH